MSTIAFGQSILLKPAAVFDGQEMHAGWSVLVTGDKIAAVGPNVAAPADARTIDLPNETLMPGMIEGHSHMFLHPYNETSWNDQVTNESFALRTARATVHARKTLEAGFTTARDLGTEGAGFGDVGLEAGDRFRNHSRPAIDRGHARDRRDGKLRAEIRERTRRSARRAGMQRRRGMHSRRARANRQRRRLGQGLCGLSLGAGRARRGRHFRRTN